MRLWKKVDSFERWLFLVSQISGVFFHVEIRGTLKYLPVPAAPKLIFRYQLNATSIFSCGFSWVQLDQIKKIFKKIGIASLKCFVTSNMMAFGQKKQYRTFDQMPAFIESWSQFIRSQIRVQTTKRNASDVVFFSCKSSFLPQRLEDFCSKTETQNGHLQIPSNSDI